MGVLSVLVIFLMSPLSFPLFLHMHVSHREHMHSGTYVHANIYTQPHMLSTHSPPHTHPREHMPHWCTLLTHLLTHIHIPHSPALTHPGSTARFLSSLWQLTEAPGPKRERETFTSSPANPLHQHLWGSKAPASVSPPFPSTSGDQERAPALWAKPVPTA